MSVGLTMFTIAACYAAGQAIGIAKQNGLLADAGSDDCPTVYADEERCECSDEALLEVDIDAEGKLICSNCGRRRL